MGARNRRKDMLKKGLFILLIFCLGSSLWAQSREVNCGRFGMNVGSTGGVSEFNWPRDFRYASNGGGSSYHILIEDWNKPNGNINGYAVPEDTEIGSWSTVSNIKKVKYPYPTITVEGIDISSTDVYDGNPDPNLISDQMVETVVNTYIGMTLRQRVFAWSHPKYQDFAIVHQQWINTGNTDADPEIELPNNDFSNFYFFQVNTFAPGNGSHDEKADRTHTKSDRSEVYSNVDVWVWEGDDPDNPGVYDPNRPQLLHVSVGNDPNDLWQGKRIDNEGDPKPETGEFMSPMFVGEGILHLDAGTDDRSHDPEKLKIMLWDDYYWLYHGATQDREDRYQVFREGLNGVRFSDDFEKDSPDPVVNSQRALSTYGPWEMAFGDTINIVFFRGVKGINANLAKEKGAEWLDWFLNGEGNFDDEAKNQLLRSGRDSLIQIYEYAKEVYANDYSLPEGMNPQPPSRLEVASIDSNHVLIEWSQPERVPMNISHYNIYTSIGSRDTRYELHESIEAEEGLTDYQYILRDPQPGFAYYFALTAVDVNGNESSLYLCRTNRLALQAGLAKSDEMDGIRVVPNPFVYDPDGIENYTGEPDKLIFAGLPGPCKIRIYTLTGDLIDEIEHRDAFSGGREFLTITRYQQFMVSGVYIYHVKSLEGKGEKTGKFIVVR
ncbi:hypothetical protein GF406_17305 [candidate division KSB1 bacterium]|nr:hypothetical protein [candidate division KSB1 bacterium]